MRSGYSLSESLPLAWESFSVFEKHVLGQVVGAGNEVGVKLLLIYFNPNLRVDAAEEA